MFKDTNDHSHKGSTEKFWVMKIGHRKAIVDVQTKPLELYIDEDVLNIIGYNSKRIKCDGRRPTKVRHNEYSYNKRHIYSEQIFLSGEQYIIMNNHEIYTMLKVSQNHNSKTQYSEDQSTNYSQFYYLNITHQTTTT
jgi:hypothetical protein